MNLVFFITITIPRINCKSIAMKSPYTLIYPLPKTPIACIAPENRTGSPKGKEIRLATIPFSGAKVLVTGSRVRHIGTYHLVDSPVNSGWHPADSPWSYIARKVKQSPGSSGMDRGKETMPWKWQVFS